MAPTTTRRVVGLLGTDVDVAVTRRSDRRRNQAIERAVAEIRRLEAVFSVFQPDSDLSRFRTGEPGPFAPELAPLLALSRSWQRRSGGTFNPNAGAFGQLWAAAASSDAEPSAEELAATAQHIAVLPYDRSPWLNLNAIAKGWIVDRALATMSVDRQIEGMWINAGGDLCHRGHGSVTVGIEDPNRPYDNAAPLHRVRLSNGAVATSGGARRAVTAAGRRRSHVVDPRTGYPADHVASATVVAPTAAEADVVATILTVMTVEDRESFMASLPDGVAFLVVGRNGDAVTNAAFDALVSEP